MINPHEMRAQRPRDPDPTATTSPTAIAKLKAAAEAKRARKRAAWGRRVAGALVLGTVLAGCGTLEKLATPGNAQGLRQATRQVCAEDRKSVV